MVVPNERGGRALNAYTIQVVVNVEITREGKKIKGDHAVRSIIYYICDVLEFDEWQSIICALG